MSPTGASTSSAAPALPRAELRLADGSVLRGEEACAAINDANREITVDTTPEEQWETAPRRRRRCDPRDQPRL